MAYDIQIYWGSGLCPSSGIKKLEHDIAETGSVSILRWSEEDDYSVGPLEKANLIHWAIDKVQNPSKSDFCKSWFIIY
jgi:hypothetical protein